MDNSVLKRCEIGAAENKKTRKAYLLLHLISCVIWHTGKSTVPSHTVFVPSFTQFFIILIAQQHHLVGKAPRKAGSGLLTKKPLKDAQRIH